MAKNCIKALLEIKRRYVLYRMVTFPITLIDV